MAKQQKAQTLEIYLKENLSYNQFENLDMALKVSPHRRTKVMNDPSIMSIPEVKILAKLLQVDPTFLIDNFECGSAKITLADSQKLYKAKKQFA